MNKKKQTEAYKHLCYWCNDPLAASEIGGHVLTCKHHPAHRYIERLLSLGRMAKAQLQQGSYAEALEILERMEEP